MFSFCFCFWKIEEIQQIFYLGRGAEWINSWNLSARGEEIKKKKKRRWKHSVTPAELLIPLTNSWFPIKMHDVSSTDQSSRLFDYYLLKQIEFQKKKNWLQFSFFIFFKLDFHFGLFTFIWNSFSQSKMDEVIANQKSDVIEAPQVLLNFLEILSCLYSAPFAQQMSRPLLFGFYWQEGHQNVFVFFVFFL